MEGRRRHVDACELYIHVSRGDKFADSFEALFFAKMFSMLLLFGVRGLQLVEEATLGTERDISRYGAEVAA